MTLSMLRGYEGYQKEELQQLIEFLKKEVKPDVVHLSNALLMGLARKIKDDLGIPVVCSLQDEDVWIDAMADDYQDQLWGMMTEKAKDIDLFIAVSDFFAKVMQPRMSIPIEKIKVIHIGVDPSRFEAHEPAMDPPVVGYMSRMNAENGFEIFIDAFVELRSDPKYKNVHARVSGGKTGDDEKFIAKQRKKLEKAGILDDVVFVDEYGEEFHNQFFKSVSMLSVPVLKGEAFGLYQVQSLACGVPLVQPELGAFPEIAKESEGGVIYSPNTPQTLASKWKEMLDDPEKLKEMSIKGRKNTEEKFNSMKLINTMLSAYESVIKPQ